jgi:predicted secreted Zn-dependent protease
MTTFELTKLRRALEETLAMETLPHCARSREELQQQLSEVIAEQDERARIRRANTDA